MKNHPLLVSLSLVLILLFGAAFNCGAYKSANDNGGSIDRGRNTVGGGLKLGEYACYGSGGQLLIGLGFKVVSASRYTDLDAKSAGTFSINGDTVTFHGGHLDGQVGENLKDYKFTIHSVSCEPFTK